MIGDQLSYSIISLRDDGLGLKTIRQLFLQVRSLFRGAGLVGEGAHVGRACALTSAMSAPWQVVVTLRVRDSYSSLRWPSSEYAWSYALSIQAGFLLIWALHAHENTLVEGLCPGTSANRVSSVSRCGQSLV